MHSPLALSRNSPWNLGLLHILHCLPLPNSGMATPVLLHILGIGGLLYCATSMASPLLLHVLGTGGLPYNNVLEGNVYQV